MSDSVYQPSLAEFRELAKGESNLIPVYREFAADLETPVSVYIKLMDADEPSFLLESVEKGEQIGRYSFIGVNPRALISLEGHTVRDTRRGETTTRELAEGEDILDVIRADLSRFNHAQLRGLPRLSGGAVGYLGYDVVRYFEKLPETAVSTLDLPDAIFMMADTLVVFDHARHKLILLSNVRVDGDVEDAYVRAIERIESVSEKLLRALPAVPQKRWGMSSGDGQTSSNKTQAEFEAMVETAKEHIAAGDIFQVVLSQRFQRKTNAHPFAIYRSLRMLNPSPYMFYFNFGKEYDMQLVGASPEMHVRLEDGIGNLRPIAGTRPRGKTEQEDLDYETDLLADPKEVAEHVMLIDLARNDLGRVSEYGSVKVKEQMIIERYSHVMHIVSQVEGRIHEDMDAYDLLRATFPAGTLSGAPKIRAMEIIEELEKERRALYGGVVGHFGYDGGMDNCIAIRTMLVQGENVYVQAGAGIVADSDPATEYQESVNKAKALLVAVDRAEQGRL